MEQVWDQILVWHNSFIYVHCVNGSKSSSCGDSLYLVESHQQLIWLSELNTWKINKNQSYCTGTDVIVYFKSWAKPVLYLAYSLSIYIFLLSSIIDRYILLFHIIILSVHEAVYLCSLWDLPCCHPQKIPQ